MRRLVFSLLLGLVLAVVSWFGWQYCAIFQRSSLAVTPPTAQPLADGVALPTAADAATPADGMALPIPPPLLWAAMVMRQRHRHARC